jgi:hypothetical protein
MGPTKPRNGRTIVQALLEELTRELDTVVELIMSEEAPEVSDFDSGVQYQDIDCAAATEACVRYGEWRGQCQGLAYALAVLKNPYQPDIEKERAEAMQRWEESQ